MNITLPDQDSPIDIASYVPAPLDGTLNNPMLAEVRELLERFSAGGIDKARTFLSFERKSLLSRYAFSIPTADTLTAVARHSALVEIGAGSGYWAMCLAACGADIVAYDIFPPVEGPPTSISEMNWQFRKVWHPVRKGNESSVAAHADRTLFLCWPPPENPMASRALDLYMKAGGKTVIVIGEMKPLSMGDAALYEMMKGLKTIERRPIYGWPGMREELHVCSCGQPPCITPGTR
jgi:hypothetical protein